MVLELATISMFLQAVAETRGLLLSGRAARSNWDRWRAKEWERHGKLKHSPSSAIALAMLRPWICGSGAGMDQ
jgi:hypothetical protein